MNRVGDGRTQRVASTSPPPRAPLPYGRFALAYVISISVIVVGLLVWESIPGKLPIHWDASGRANSFASKGWLSAFAGAWIGLFLTTVLLLGAIVSRRRAFRVVPGADDELLREQETVDQWATHGTCASVALVFSVATALLSLLSWLDKASSVAVLVVTITMLTALLATIFGYQTARRATRSPETAWSDVGGGDDTKWFAGLVYVNRQDKAAIVPTRFGAGWTLNSGRPAVMVLGVSSVALVVAGVVLTLVLAG